MKRRAFLKYLAASAAVAPVLLFKPEADEPPLVEDRPVTDGDALTAERWNHLVDAVRTLDERTR